MPDQRPPFDLVGWVLDLVKVAPEGLVLDIGCGNGAYLRALRARGIRAVGVDLSVGMLRASAHALVISGDVLALPVADAVADLVLAAHMLYHLENWVAAARELRRVLKPGAVCVAVTNGSRSMASLHAVVEAAVRRSDPGWVMRTPSTHMFSLDGGAADLSEVFGQVDVVRPERTDEVHICDSGVVADYVASVADLYQPEVTQPWAEVVEEVRRRVATTIKRDGAFLISGDVGAFVCRRDREPAR